jgi:uncharacterized damage-inducible protein DinB
MFDWRLACRLELHYAFSGSKMSEIERIVDQMDRAFSGDAWHGPPLLLLLEGVTAEAAAKHPVAGAHSIWEIANHVAAWNMIVRRRIAGEEVNVTPELDWPHVEETTPVDWRRTLDNLKDSRARLRSVVQALADERLREQVIGKDYPLYVMLHGLVQHDLYHAGQVAVLKKALAGAARP